MKSLNNSFNEFVSDLTTEQLWEAYFFLKNSLEMLPRISSAKMLYIIMHSFKDDERPLLEFTKVALSLKIKLVKEIQIRNAN